MESFWNILKSTKIILIKKLSKITMFGSLENLVIVIILRDNNYFSKMSGGMWDGKFLNFRYAQAQKPKNKILYFFNFENCYLDLSWNSRVKGS